MCASTVDKKWSIFKKGGPIYKNTHTPFLEGGEEGGGRVDQLLYFNCMARRI